MSRRHVIITIAAVAIVAAAVVVYTLFDPAGSAWFPRCPVYMFTGLKCPGCGSQRMVHALLQGDVAAAFRHNAMLLLMLPLLALLIVAEPLRKRCPRLYTGLYSNYVVGTALVLIAVWTVVRNIFGW